MNNTITKLLLTGVLSVGTIGTAGVMNESKESKVERKEITLEEAKDKVLSQVNGTIERTKEEHDEYKIYTKSGDYVYEIEVDKLTGKVTEVDKEFVEKNNSKVYSLDKAKVLALEKVNGTIERTSEDEDDYTIYVKKDGYIYEVEVDKLTGKVDEIDREKVKSTVKQSTVQKSSYITLEKAKELALKEVNGKIMNSRSDEDDYEIIIEKDGYRYEVDVDKRTGRIDDFDKEMIKKSLTVINKEEAKKIALGKVNGTVRSIEYDHDDLEYSIEIVKDRVEYEVEISADGKVLKVEKDD